METENRQPEEQAAERAQEGAESAATETETAEAECADCAEEAAEGEATEPDAAEELAHVKDQLMRLAAEFENYKKRMKNEQDKLAKYAGESILRDLLPTVDNLERALGQGADSQGDAESRLKGLMEGVELTHKSLLATLERFGVTAVESVGQPFNPEEQNAMTMEASAEVAANHVIREFAKGYRFKDRMLRHAMVVVSSGPGN